MIKLKDILLENPDCVDLPNGKLICNKDFQAVPFLYDVKKNIVYISKTRSLHHETDEFYSVDGKNATESNLGNFDYDGRLFTKDKIISFWTFPSKSIFKKIIDQLKKHGIKINSSWKVELIVDEAGDIYHPSNDGWNNGFVESKGLKIVFVPINNYGRGTKIKNTVPAQRHVQSPLSKKKIDVPVGLGSKKLPKNIRPGETIAQYNFRTKQESKYKSTDIITESPDSVFYEDKLYSVGHKKALPFAYDTRNKTTYIGEYGTYHLREKLIDKNGNSMLDHGTFPDDEKVIVGRLFTNIKVITFWKYPNKSIFKFIIKGLEQLLRKKIMNDPRWEVELPGDQRKKYDNRKFVPVQEFIGGVVRKNFDFATRHVQSPMTKGKISVPKGVGSRKLPKGMKPGETIAQYNFRTKQESLYRKFYTHLLSESFKISKRDIEKAEDRNSYDREVSLTAKVLLDNWDEDYVKDWIVIAEKAINKALKLLGKVPYYNENDLYRQVLSLTDFPTKVKDFFPIAVYVSSKNSDRNTIGIFVHYNGKKEIFEGNDEASDETYQLVNNLLGYRQDVVVWAMHGQSVIEKIRKTNKLPANLYVSPRKSYAEGYWSLKEKDKQLFKCTVNLYDLRQESEYDWKTIKETPIKKLQIF